MTIPQIENEIRVLHETKNEQAKEIESLRNDLVELRGQLEVGRLPQEVVGKSSFSNEYPRR